MERYVIDRTEDGVTIRMASVGEEEQAINYLTDAVYNALVDHTSLRLTARQGEPGAERLYASVQVEMYTSP